MTSSQLHDLDAIMRVEQEQEHPQSGGGQHASSPPATSETKEATSPPPPSYDHHFRPSLTPYNHRSPADEVLVGPNDDDTFIPPPSFHQGDAESVHSVVGTCIEIELAEGLNDGAPLFRSPNFNGEGPGHLVGASPGKPVETRKQSMKRRASRMSHTFESFGRGVRRRVSSLWSKDGKEQRKDSRWVSLGGDAAQKQQDAGETGPERRWTSKGAANGTGSGSKQHNPYPAVTSLVARRAAQNESRATSPTWTPYTSDARSTTGVLEGEISSVVAPDADSREDSLTRAARSEDFRFLTAEEIDTDRHISPPDGSRTPLEERPAGSSMLQGGYTLDQHLSKAMELGRFDMNRIEQRFNAGEPEPATTQESSFDDVAFFAQTPSVVDDDHESLAETIAAESYHSATEIFEPSEPRRRSSWLFWLRGWSSQQPREPRPSVAHVEEEREPASSFGTTFAQVAGVVGTSMQQGNSSVML